MSFITKIFGDSNEKYLKSLQPLVEEINNLEKEFEDFSDEALKGKTKEFKERLQKGESLDDILSKAFALVREAAKRTLNQRHFDVQLMGGIALHQGKIAEMKTGEGKTLAATLPLYLNALEEKGCHLITVNDYLAKRDTVWMGQIYYALGLSTGCIVHETAYLYDPEYQWQNQISNIKNQKFNRNEFPESGSKNQKGTSSSPARAKIKNDENELDKKRDAVGGFKVIESYLRPVTRKEAYLADITYGTNNEFGFDYLRDNMVYPHTRTSEFLVPDDNRSFGVGVDDLQVQRPARNASPASNGVATAGWHSDAGGGLHYVIIDEIDSILIDEARTPLIISAPDTESSKWYVEFARITPRLNPDTDYEIDEKMKTVTLTEEGINRVEKILGLGNIYEEKGIKYLHHLEQALRAETLFKRDNDYLVKDGQVVIIDEFTGRLLYGRRYSGGLHQAIEAKEGARVQQESLTLATITFQNYFRMYKKLAGMTGTAATSAEEFFKVYGADVVIVPTNKPMIRKDLPDRIYKTEEGKFKAVAREIKERYEKGQPVLVGTRSVEKNEYLGKMLEKEGIPHQILNAKHHEKEGEIIAQAGKPKAVTVATNMAGRGVDIVLGGYPPPEIKNNGDSDGSAREEFEKWQEEHNKVVSLGGLHVIGTERHEARRIDNQLRGRAGRQGDPGSSQFFVSLEDDLMRIFGGERIKSLMNTLKIADDEPIEAGLISKAIEDAQSKIEGMNFDLRKHILEYDDVMNKHRETVYRKRREILRSSADDLKQKIIEMARKEEYSQEDYEKKEEEIGKDIFYQVSRAVFLRTIDSLWLEHLENMDYLRDSVRIRAYGQQDPLIEYKIDSRRMFQELLETIDKNIVQTLFKVEIKKEKSSQGLSFPGNRDYQRQNNAGNFKKVGRNDPCPCGAKKPDGRPVKYKHCHGRNI